jgi:hypothetical protein
MEGLYLPDEVKNMIIEGQRLLLAGDEELLNKLPEGNWIGGTIPYFMGDEGGVYTKEKVFVNTLPAIVEDIKIKYYDLESLPGIANDEFENGFTFMILPGLSDILTTFARNSNSYENIFNKPLLGWVSGVELGLEGRKTAKVFNGYTNSNSDSKAVVMHMKLPENKTAVLDMVNIFRQGDGDKIQFLETGFSAGDCLINGQIRNFADYLTGCRADIRLPLVADYYSAMVNIGFRGIDRVNKTVNFYAPVFTDIQYMLAAPVDDYVAEFTKIVKNLQIKPYFSCNCLLNYLYSELEGKKTFDFKGPITFGEIAYQLLNQTMIYLTIEDINSEN